MPPRKEPPTKFTPILSAWTAGSNARQERKAASDKTKWRCLLMFFNPFNPPVLDGRQIWIVVPGRSWDCILTVGNFDRLRVNAQLVLIGMGPFCGNRS